MKNEQKQNSNGCGTQSCGCSKNVDDIIVNSDPLTDLAKTKNKISENKENEKTLDPTHFGDWQVGCRTIDF